MSRTILIANCVLAGRSGTEMYTHDLARQLIQMGDRPIIYSTQTGLLAEVLRKQSIPVIDSLDQLAEAPDLIQGHHLLETLTSLLHFPNSPAIFVCHDAYTWHSHAPAFPRIYRHVAVDRACYDRINLSGKIPSERIHLIQNGVNLDRFHRRDDLPTQPKRALLFSNYATKANRMVIESACKSVGIQLDAIGSKFNGEQARPEDILPGYDLVFAKGRCAWEALASGCAVMICDRDACGELVTTHQLDYQAECNFGRRLLNRELSHQNILRELQKYDATDAKQVTNQVRKRSDLTRIACVLGDLYDQVILEHAEKLHSEKLHSETVHSATERSETQRSHHAELLAAGEILQWLSSQSLRPPRTKARTTLGFKQMSRWMGKWIPKSFPASKHRRAA